MMPSKRSLVLITVDCLRADHCSFLGYGRPTTPFLNMLAAQSWVFTNATAAGVPTYYSLPSIVASRYPLALGRDAVGLAPDEPTLASTLKSAGYATGCFSAANPYLSRRFGYDQAFDTFRDFLDTETNTVPQFSPPLDDGNKLRSRANRRLVQLSRQLGISSVYNELYFRYCQWVTASPAQSLDSLHRFPTAEMIVDQARVWLASKPQGPFFLWLHFMDPHSPYYPVQQSMDIMGNGKITPSRVRYLNAYWNRNDLGSSRLRRRRESIVELHDACVRWVDAQVERLVGILRQFDLWNSCTLAFTADHGEEFLEHGGRFHAPSKLTEELVHVPLLLRVPDAQPCVEHSPFSLLHLAPTVLDALAVRPPSDFQGKSLYAEIERRENWDFPTVTECVSDCRDPFCLEKRMGPRLLSVRQKQYKLVIDFKNCEVRMFNLETDPAERTPLPPGTAVQTCRRLLEIARAHIESSGPERNSGRRLGALLRDVKVTLGSRPSANGENRMVNCVGA